MLLFLVEYKRPFFFICDVNIYAVRLIIGLISNKIITYATLHECRRGEERENVGTGEGRGGKEGGKDRG